MYLTADDMEGTLISDIPKCGSQSIGRVIRNKPSHLQVDADDSLRYRTRVMFLRHPITRLDSCWSFFRHKRVELYPLKTLLPDNIVRGRRGMEQEEYEEFIDHIISEENTHWDSQIDLLTTSDGVFTPTIIHKFEDIKIYWENYAVGELPWDNAFSKVPHADYRVDDISHKYARDLALWESL